LAKTVRCNANSSLKIKSLLIDFWLLIWSWFCQE
jgi:hypothetical protein